MNTGAEKFAPPREFPRARERPDSTALSGLLGATQQHIVRLVLENGATLVVLGIAAGMVMTLAGSRIVDRFLFGVSMDDLLTLIGVVPVLGGVTLIARTIPAWRKARVDPAIALRSDCTSRNASSPPDAARLGVPSLSDSSPR